MKTGRPRKPTKLKLLEGNWRPDTQPHNEAQPNAEAPVLPPHIVDEAQAEWIRVTEELQILGLLARIDRAALAAYCEAWATYVYACEMIRRPMEYGGGMVVTSPRGVGVSPWFTIKEKAAKMMHTFLVEFGMTPASRSRINVTEDGSGKKSGKDKNFA